MQNETSRYSVNNEMNILGDHDKQRGFSFLLEDISEKHRQRVSCSLGNVHSFPDNDLTHDSPNYALENCDPQKQHSQTQLTNP